VTVVGRNGRPLEGGEPPVLRMGTGSVSGNRRRVFREWLGRAPLLKPERRAASASVRRSTHVAPCTAWAPQALRKSVSCDLGVEGTPRVPCVRDESPAGSRRRLDAQHDCPAGEAGDALQPALPV